MWSGDSASPHLPQVCEGAGRRGSQSHPRAAGSACGLGVCLGGGLCSPFPLKVLFPWGTLSRAWPKNPRLPTQTAAILPRPSLSIFLHSSPPNPQASSFFQQQLHFRGPYLLLFRDNQLAEAVAPILWPPDVKSRLIGRDPDAGKDWGQEEKRMTKDGMVGWHHQLNGHEFEQTPGDGEAWLVAVHWVARSRTWLSSWTTTIRTDGDSRVIILKNFFCSSCPRILGKQRDTARSLWISSPGSAPLDAIIYKTLLSTVWLVIFLKRLSWAALSEAFWKVNYVHRVNLVSSFINLEIIPVMLPENAWCNRSHECSN